MTQLLLSAVVMQKVDRANLGVLGGVLSLHAGQQSCAQCAGRGCSSSGRSVITHESLTMRSTCLSSTTKNAVCYNPVNIYTQKLLQEPLLWKLHPSVNMAWCWIMLTTTTLQPAKPVRCF